MIGSASEFFEIVQNGTADDYERIFEESSDEIWIEILRDPMAEEHVVKNNTISPAVLDVLAGSESDFIRSQVAEKRRLNTETFKKLSNDSLPWVRVRVACNKKCPIKILELLALDNDQEVAETARAQIAKRSC